MRNIIHEIHRRSLWQVLGIYLAVSWVVLQVVDVVGNNFGLPDWVAPAALVLLLLGLPIVIGTAFVQEGMRGRGGEGPSPSPADPAERDRDAAEGAGVHEPSGANAFPTPGDGHGRHHRLLTWRNALLGGGAAFAFLGLLTAGYLFMRASGIGPAGTLVAQGVFEDGARVILADFESGDPELADVVTGALRIDLLDSPTIRVAERPDLSDGLVRMQLPAGARITGDVARELAQREGYAAVIQGEIGTAGAGYVLTASIVGGEAWTSLAGFRATARSENDLIDAIESLSRDIRDKSGESLRTVRGAPPLELVTTGSLEALRLYWRADALEQEADRAGAVDLYERAIEIDPEFAMAHRKLGVVLNNMGIRRADRIRAVTRAFELRDRLPEVEGYLAEAFYRGAVLGDRSGTIRAYEGVLEIAPDNVAALNNLSIDYRVMGRFEEAEGLLERALAVRPFQVGFTNLANARFLLGEDEAGLAALDLATAALPGAESVFENVRIHLALERARFDEAEALSIGYGERFGRPADVVRHANHRFALDGVRGRLRAAESHVDRLDDAPTGFGHPVTMAGRLAALRLLRGDSAGAVRLLHEAAEMVRDSLPPVERRYRQSITGLLEAGGRVEAEALHDEWLRQVRDDDLSAQDRDGRRRVDAELAFAAGDLAGAIRLWGEFERGCPGTCGLAASLGLARAHDAAGDGEAAVAEYERHLQVSALGGRAISDVRNRGPVLERLGQLHEVRGDATGAADYYGQLVDLWADADEELQPRVRAARARLEELGSVGG